MVVAKRAPVKPRVRSPTTGEAVPLEDEIRPWLETRCRGRIAVTGPPGSGKTTALEHLAAVLLSDFPVAFWDDVPGAAASLVAGPGLVIYAAPVPRKGEHLAVLSLEPWNLDDAIEYLLAVHKDRTASVIRRLRAAPDRDLLSGTAELWSIVLGPMAADESISDVTAALQGYLHRQSLDARVQQLIRSASLATFVEEVQGPDLPTLKKHGCHWEALRAFRHETVRLLLASEKIRADLHAEKPCDYFGKPLRRNLVQITAGAVMGDAAALEHLHRLLADFPWKQAMAASILHATGTGWRPAAGRIPVLAGAFLARVNWPGLNFEGTSLAETDFSGANLEGAVLDRVTAVKTNFTLANLRGASLNALRASEAIFTHADLSGVHGREVQLHFADLDHANLQGAQLKSADLYGANLASANFRQADLSNSRIIATQLQDADFTAARLDAANLRGAKLCQAQFSGASFIGAKLHLADLEGIGLPGADFNHATLDGALLTGVSMPGANLAHASLRHTGLADVNLEGANLTHADLTGATFHLGSARSGRVDNYIASEGTRTGFYTDDYEEQYFKNPEDIRKANLCGADLRGALLEEVDFYLVDVRGAQYDPQQEKHLRRCRAILEDRG